jgi:hypothetical protein
MSYLDDVIREKRARAFKENKEFKPQLASDGFTIIYHCPQCGSQLAEGPSGGSSVNLVCHKCKINYGCF